MTAPVERRSIKVSPEVHTAVHDLAEHLGTTADQAILHLLNLSTVRLDLSDTQRQRWQAYADTAGVRLDQWIVMRCEAAMQYGTDQATIGTVLDHVRALTAAAGLQVTRRAVPVRRRSLAEPPTEESDR